MKNLEKSFFTLCVWGLAFGAAEAGVLRDFEADATREVPSTGGQPKSNQTNSARNPDDKGVFTKWFWDPLANDLCKPIFNGILAGAINSYHYSLDKFDFVKPDIGGNNDALLPFFRVDLGKHFISNEINGNELKATMGFGPISVEFRQNRYWELGDPTELRLDQWRMQFRFLAYDRVAMGISSGISQLTGKKVHEGTNWHIPVLIRLNRDLYLFVENGVQILENGAEVGDHSIELRYGSHYFSTYFGYHWLRATQTSLKGPTAGLSFYF